MLEVLEIHCLCGHALLDNFPKKMQYLVSLMRQKQSASAVRAHSESDTQANMNCINSALMVASMTISCSGKVRPVEGRPVV